MALNMLPFFISMVYILYGGMKTDMVKKNKISMINELLRIKTNSDDSIERQSL